MNQQIEPLQLTESLDHRKRQIIQFVWVEKGEVEPIFIDAGNNSSSCLFSAADFHNGRTASIFYALCGGFTFLAIVVSDVDF
jgi:hypothetical protein